MLTARAAAMRSSAPEPSAPGASHRTRLGVLGWPVAHSRSPAIQGAALRAVGLSRWRYQLLPVPPELFSETARALPSAGFRGANVTIPHKQAALRLADRASASARAIGASNTLTFDDSGAIDAENTDAPALIEALPFSPAGRTALVLGAGGSARAAVWALLDAGAREVRVWNRNPPRARRLCAELGGTPVQVAGPADVLVNCTSVGLDQAEVTLQQLPIEPDQLGRFGCIVDLVYREGGTPLARAASALSIPVVDGLELLVGQGALSFERFTGRPAPIGVMRAAAGLGPTIEPGR
jgi:shikimate dehydrogenase